jgi:hypothetical protein
MEQISQPILNLQTELRELEAKKADDKKAIANLKRLLDQETERDNEPVLRGKGLESSQNPA